MADGDLTPHCDGVSVGTVQGQGQAGLASGESCIRSRQNILWPWRGSAVAAAPQPSSMDLHKPLRVVRITDIPSRTRPESTRCFGCKDRFQHYNLCAYSLLLFPPRIHSSPLAGPFNPRWTRRPWFHRLHHFCHCTRRLWGRYGRWGRKLAHATAFLLFLQPQSSPLLPLLLPT